MQRFQCHVLWPALKRLQRKDDLAQVGFRAGGLHHSLERGIAVGRLWQQGIGKRGRRFAPHHIFGRGGVGQQLMLLEQGDGA